MSISACKYLASHLFVLLCMSLLYILLVMLWKEITSKSLLMSSVMKRFPCGGLTKLMILKLLSVRSVRRAFC